MAFDLLATIARLQRQGSDDAHVEAKAAASRLGTSVWDSVSAFANTAGGTLLLGLSEECGFTPVMGFDLARVRDQFVDGMGDGNPSGVKLTRPPRYDIERAEVDEQPILVVHIHENALDAKPCFVTAKGVLGGSFHRVDDKDIALTAAAIFELEHVNQASTADRVIVADATLDDLDPARVDALIDAHRNGKALVGAADRTARLRRLNVIDGTGGSASRPCSPSATTPSSSSPGCSSM